MTADGPQTLRFTLSGKFIGNTDVSNVLYVFIILPGQQKIKMSCISKKSYLSSCRLVYFDMDLEQISVFVTIPLRITMRRGSYESIKTSTAGSSVTVRSEHRCAPAPPAPTLTSRSHASSHRSRICRNYPLRERCSRQQPSRHPGESRTEV